MITTLVLVAALAALMVPLIRRDLRRAATRRKFRHAERLAEAFGALRIVLVDQFTPELIKAGAAMREFKKAMQ